MSLGCIEFIGRVGRREREEEREGSGRERQRSTCLEEREKLGVDGACFLKVQEING